VDKTVLAEEQVNSEMRSWRSGAKVEKKLLQQWFIRTTVFADRLSIGLASGDLKHGWRDVIDLQKHWIGSIKGYFTDCLVDISSFKKVQSDAVSSIEPLRVWFSNVDSLKTAKYFILRPDHFLLDGEDCILKTFSNGIKLMKFGIANPITGKVLPLFSGPSDHLPCVPPSSDCRVDEVLREDDFQEIAMHESFLNEMTESCNQIEAKEVC